MARSTISTTSPKKTSASSLIPQPLTTEILRMYTKTVAVSSKKLKAPRLASPERTFLCYDKNYPRTRPKPLQPIQKVYVSSGPSVHWRGDDRALFELDPVAKYNIRDYLLGQCKALRQTTNELTKPTGTKIVFILQFNVDDAEQEALCVQTNAATFNGIYNFRDVHPSNKKAPTARKMSTTSAKNVPLRRLPRSRGTTSLTRLMASANEEGFPLPDRELDSDSDQDQDETTPPPYTTALDVITEGDEDEEGGFVDVGDLDVPKYCDPDSANHPECHGRYKAVSYAHNVVDAELDFQERFVTAHSDHDSAAYYRNWRVLKHDYGETMVHGQSLLRKPVTSTGGYSEKSDSDGELDDGTEQLLRLIDKKYGPLTLEGQKAKPAEPATKGPEKCIAKVNEYLDRDPDDDPQHLGQLFDFENEDAVSQPETLFGGVDDLNDDEDITAPASTPTSAQPRSSNAPVMTEEELEKVSSICCFGKMSYTDCAQLINMPHEGFVNSYMQRHGTMRIDATRAKQVRVETLQSSGSLEEVKGRPIIASDTVVEQVVALLELIVTAAAPASSPVKDTISSTDQAAEGHRYAIETALDAPAMVSEAVPEQLASARPCDVTVSVPAGVPIEAAAPQVLPVMVSHEAVPAEISTRPASARSMCSSRDGSSLPASVFSRRASVTTKPSNESFWSNSLRRMDTLDLQVDVESAPTTVSHHDRSVSMPTLTLSSPNTNETTIGVSLSDQNAHAQATYVGPSTPIRAAPTVNKCLTPIIEVQTPMSSSSMPPTTMYTSTVMDDPYEGVPTPNFHYPQSHVRMPPRAPDVWRDEPVAPMPTSVFTDDSSFTDRRPRSNKFAPGIKYRAHAVADATMQAARRVVRSVKKMRATSQYFVPVTFGSRNPFETASRR